MDIGVVENVVGVCGDGEGVWLYVEVVWCVECVFCGDGWVEIDNNICENVLWCVVLGWCNYLFFGLDRSGEVVVIIYSLLGMCKLNDVEFEVWLCDVLWKISDWLLNWVYELLFWNFEIVK